MHSNEFSKFLNSINSEPFRVLDANIPSSKYVSIDLSESNQTLNSIDMSSSVKLGTYIDSHIKEHGGLVAYGGYLEVRNIYKRSDHFKSQSQEGRNIHLGVDLWSNAETPIYTPLDATVHSFNNNSNYGDYGPTIILKHIISEVVFYTLYGHLSMASIKNLKIGKPFKQGDKIGELGDASVNGDYPPHLHFQIIKDIQKFIGDYPGVCSKEDSGFYVNNCPNPDVLLKFKI
ncbi:peptidoglycan DD-metalloendopeptidase family protein [Flavivirga aquimarina]|uniref:Peptidoglycan DD-metalloendopeptidase family protein n=1 Tax=Flavivirga aquimarina TaxID=2027862 RepID=A0ABT8WBR7_9FLAO|nr:peptidoglycan DD-metalloendopeptidase family protein [Flavivirga aquimarina]MDO5970594.1 peptidoglycan DD-metalloendopeptidase family protein [Flavivirga aquimarina]